MLKKTSLLLLTIACLTACAEENASEQPKIEEPVNQEVEIVETDQTEIEDVETVDQTQVEVVEPQETLDVSEIRTIMDKFEKMRQLVIDTHRTLTFTEEEFYSPELQTAKVMENLPESIHDLISTNMLNNQLPQLLQSMYEASGEGGFLPDINMDARMEIIENTPEKVQIKTFQLVEEIVYKSNHNVYLTAIEENGQWVIDEYAGTNVDKEPLQLTREEVIIHEQMVQDSEIEFVAEETITSESDLSLSKTANAIIVRIVKDGRLLARFTETGEIAYDIPEKYK
ncbi:hypothetical protein [Paenisporosarcina quisquiliarum]|uniref:hypothetical protein n=1 Tax=Paenisporosarcina quisquiliarum TaxID=365346 RepID=UPI00373531FC